MELLVSKYIKTESLDKDDLEITSHKVVLKGSYGDVKIQMTVDSTDVSQLKKMVPIERGMPFELELDV
jgi:hypothetical protein